MHMVFKGNSNNNSKASTHVSVTGKSKNLSGKERD